MPDPGADQPRRRCRRGRRPHAYLAAFHAAQALIAERTGRTAKTHKGAHAQFARLTRGEPRLDVELRRFLARLTISNRSRITGWDPTPTCRSTGPRRRSIPRSNL